MYLKYLQKSILYLAEKGIFNRFVCFKVLYLPIGSSIYPMKISRITP